MAAKSTLEIIINGTTKGAEKAFSGLTKSITTLGKVAVGLGVGAAAGIAGLGAAAMKLAIDAAPLERVQQTFDNLSDSFEDGGQAMLTALQKASLGMISNRDLMTSFNKAAQLVSLDFAQKLPDAMQYLGKVSAATGQDMSFMMDSLVTGIGRLSPMILDNLGIQVSLTEANEIYAKSIGKSTEELTKSEQQTALMNQVLEKLAANTAAMPDLTGSAIQQWESLKVSFTNIKDEIGLALLPAFQSILSEVNENLMPFIQDVLVPWLKDKIPEAIAILSKFWTETLLPAIKAVWDWISGTLIPFFQNTVKPWLDDKLPKAIKVLSDFWEFTLKPAMTRVWEWMTGTLLPFLTDTVFPWLQEKIPAALATLSRFWEFTLKPAMMAVWNWMQTVLMPFFTDTVTPYLRDEMPQNLSDAGKAWAEFKGKLVDLNSWMEINIIPLLWELDDLLGTTLTITINEISDVIDVTLKPAWKRLNDYFEEHIIPILWEIDNFFNFTLGPSIKTFIEDVVNWLIDRLEALNAILDQVLNKQGKVSDGGSGGGRGKALGGTVMGGAPYAVGNELFVPNTSGYIVNNWNLTANYAYQSPNNLVQEIRLLEMLHT